jgi:23S rRNA (adenine2503-C2)-methyltransferase
MRSSMSKVDIKSMSSTQLRQYVTEELSEKPFRAKQLYEWIHRRLATDFDEMTNLSKELRQTLRDKCTIQGTEIVQEQISRQDGTRKYLMGLADGNTVESVLMKYKHGNSVCISSQVGCRMGCRFCASTVGGLARCLTTAEMLDQIYTIQRSHPEERISNVIIMGIGEPLDNFDNVVQFIRMLSAKEGLNISQRNITLSTCGLVDGIYRLMEEELTITLAISLHAPNDDIRRQMMPVAERFTIREITDACREYIRRTGRRVTFEYTMVQGVNDSKEHAEELCSVLRGMNCHVNLIPLNSVEGRLGSRSMPQNIQDFKFILEKNWINVTIRREMGSDIDAACGQLRNKNKGGETT